MIHSSRAVARWEINIRGSNKKKTHYQLHQSTIQCWHKGHISTLRLLFLLELVSRNNAHYSQQCKYLKYIVISSVEFCHHLTKWNINVQQRSQIVIIFVHVHKPHMCYIIHIRLHYVMFMIIKKYIWRGSCLIKCDSLYMRLASALANRMT